MTHWTGKRNDDHVLLGVQPDIHPILVLCILFFFARASSETLEIRKCREYYSMATDRPGRVEGPIVRSADELL
jgi:hypothetical protein